MRRERLHLPQLSGRDRERQQTPLVVGPGRAGEALSLRPHQIHAAADSWGPFVRRASLPGRRFDRKLSFDRGRRMPVRLGTKCVRSLRAVSVMGGCRARMAGQGLSGPKLIEVGWYSGASMRSASLEPRLSASRVSRAEASISWYLSMGISVKSIGSALSPVFKNRA